MSWSDQCALDASGGLKDVNDIEFYESETDIRPVPKQASIQLEGVLGIFTNSESLCSLYLQLHV
jgi:hypothetical protein